MFINETRKLPQRVVYWNAIPALLLHIWYIPNFAPAPLGVAKLALTLSTNTAANFYRPSSYPSSVNDT